MVAADASRCMWRGRQLVSHMGGLSNPHGQSSGPAMYGLGWKWLVATGSGASVCVCANCKENAPHVWQVGNGHCGYRNDNNLFVCRVLAGILRSDANAIILVSREAVVRVEAYRSRRVVEKSDCSCHACRILFRAGCRHFQCLKKKFIDDFSSCRVYRIWTTWSFSPSGALEYPPHLLLMILANMWCLAVRCSWTHIPSVLALHLQRLWRCVCLWWCSLTSSVYYK